MTNQSDATKNKITLADVAAASNVSPATVSLVLRDKPGVGAKTRQRVLDAAQALGYLHKPSLQNQTQAHPQISTVGLIVRTRPDDPLSSNDFYAPVLAGIEAICRSRQINLMYSNLPVDRSNRPLELPALLGNEQIDGFLLVGMCVDEATTAVVKSQNLPIVLVDAYAPKNPYDAVVSGNFEGAVEAMNYLLDQGHREIAIAGSQPGAYPSIAARRAGYEKVLNDNGLPHHFIDSALLPEPAAKETVAYLSKHREVTAVFGCNDKIAIAIMQAVATTGRKVPQELSVIGFDNILLAQHVTPALTTMRIDKTNMGRMAMQLLLNRIAYPASGKIQAVIQPQLLERHSVTQPAT